MCGCFECTITKCVCVRRVLVALNDCSTLLKYLPQMKCFSPSCNHFCVLGDENLFSCISSKVEFFVQMQTCAFDEGQYGEALCERVLAFDTKKLKTCFDDENAFPCAQCQNFFKLHRCNRIAVVHILYNFCDIWTCASAPNFMC